MTKSIASLKGEYGTIRANRATAAVLDRITVDYYGTATPINQLAAISVVEARILCIQPWTFLLCIPSRRLSRPPISELTRRTTER